MRLWAIKKQSQNKPNVETTPELRVVRPEKAGFLRRFGRYASTGFGKNLSDFI